MQRLRSFSPALRSPGPAERLEIALWSCEEAGSKIPEFLAMAEPSVFSKIFFPRRSHTDLEVLNFLLQNFTTFISQTEGDKTLKLPWATNISDRI